jgi:hypothetical protein
MRVLIVANACPWVSWPAKIAAIKAFYAPLVELDIDIQYTDFPSVPTNTVPGTVTTFGPTGATDTPGIDIDIDPAWLTQNVIPLATGYDIVVFQTATILPREGLPLGITIGQLDGVWCCMTFTTVETGVYNLPGSYAVPQQAGMVNLGDLATIIIEHELSHALYELSDQADNTHLYFYSDRFARVLTDIVLPSMKGVTLISLYQQVVQDLEAELGMLKAQPSTADMNPPAPAPTFPPMITKWIAAIKQWEGANPELHNGGNLKLTTLTKSWGATQGPAAADGGYLCQFRTEGIGDTALGNFLTLGCEDELVAFHAPAARTLEGFTNIYAGNPPQGYIDGIIAMMGVPGGTEISTFLS